MQIVHTVRDRDATAVYHALDEMCYRTNSDLSRVELFASFRLFTMSISVSLNAAGAMLSPDLLSSYEMDSADPRCNAG